MKSVVNFLSFINSDIFLRYKYNMLITLMTWFDLKNGMSYEIFFPYFSAPRKFIYTNMGRVFGFLPKTSMKVPEY